jgi:hypothetical protein
MPFKALAVFSLLLVFFSCKKSTSYQIVLLNELPEQLSVKVYASSLNLSKDSVVLEPAQQFELFYREEDGLHSVYQCENLLDSVFIYSNKHKIKVEINNTALWTYSENRGKYKEEHKCSLSIGSGDTIQ